MKVSSEETVEQSIDVIMLIEELQEKYKYVYWTHKDNHIYIYKPLGRKDYREISMNEELTNIEKEDEVIKACLLYPKFTEEEFDNSEAGLFTFLYETILKNSYMDSIDTRMAVMEAYRSQMYDFQEQATCIINEAFPQFDIEEIENWGVQQTAKYLSRAEWKLQNLRGASFNEEYFSQLEAMRQQATSEQEPQEEMKEKQASEKTENKKTPLTPEKLAELKRQYPEVDFDNDSFLQDGFSALSQTIDTTPPALRVGGV